MKPNFSKSLMFFFITFASAAVFAQKKGDYTIIQDREVSLISKDSIIYTEEYVNEASRMLFLTKNDMQRKRTQAIPKELEKFYLIHEYQGHYFYYLKNVMSVDSKEGLRVRKEPSLKSQKICTLPDRFNVVVTCLGEEVTIDNIKSAWVEVLLPQYLWSGPKAEFGWVFGGYLKDQVRHEDYFSLAEQSGNDRTYYEVMEGDLYLPYNSPHLYDIIAGNSVYDLYNITTGNIMKDRYWGKNPDWKSIYEYERTTSLELLRLIYCGVIPNPDFDNNGKYYEPNFDNFWDLVQEKRQIHPDRLFEDSHLETEDFLRGKTVSLDLQKRSLVFTNPDSKKVYTASIPGDYMKDFSVEGMEELEIQSYQPKLPELSEPFIGIKKKVYENECVYHYEVFYYHIKGGELIKFLKIITLPEILDDYAWHFWGGNDPEDDDYLCISSDYRSFFQGRKHDDVINIKPHPEYPYIQIAKDSCHNFDIIQIGPHFNSFD